MIKEKIICHDLRGLMRYRRKNNIMNFKTKWRAVEVGPVFPMIILIIFFGDKIISCAPI